MAGDYWGWSVGKSLTLICRFKIFNDDFSFMRHFDFRCCSGTSLNLESCPVNFEGLTFQDSSCHDPPSVAQK